MPYPLCSRLKPSSWNHVNLPEEMRKWALAKQDWRNGCQGSKSSTCDPGSLGMVLGNTCWGFWLSSEREGRVMVVMVFLGGVFPFAPLHRDQAVPPEEPAPLGNWWSRLGCWEQGRLPASCRLWHLFFEYSFSVNEKNTRLRNWVERYGGRPLSKDLGEVREAGAWAVRLQAGIQVLHAAAWPWTRHSLSLNLPPFVVK